MKIKSVVISMLALFIVTFLIISIVRVIELRSAGFKVIQGTVHR